MTKTNCSAPNKQYHPETVCEDLATWIEIFNEIEPSCAEVGWCYFLCPSRLEAEQAEREHHETTRHRPSHFPAGRF
jgi:hypothetical protein